MSDEGQVNILLVDDQPGKLLSYEVVLSSLNENMIKAGSAKEALEHLLRTDIAVVLLDVCMPDIDGFELAEMIRKHPRCEKTSIILVSAIYLSDFDRLRGYGCGAVDYVPVPVVPELLRAKVSVFADLYRKTEQLSRLNSELERRVAERTAELEISTDTERRARAAAEEANRAKDEFLATLSHEMRTPINAVLGWVQLMQCRLMDQETIAEGLVAIERGVRAQVGLIDELLDVNRISSGKLRIRDDDVELEGVLNAAIETVTPEADERRISIERTGIASGMIVRGDAIRLQQLFWNLLTNATKFTPHGGRITTRVERTGQSIQISVTDTGEGIPAEFLPHVFDRFRQADSSTTRRHGGLGLGLAIAKYIAEMHGGSIQAESDGLNRGSRFAVALPLMAVRGDNGSAATAKASLPSTDLTGIHVLVVDDDLSTREIVARILREYAAEIQTADSADEALRTLARWRPHVLISDIGMPVKDGLALIREVRARPDSALIPAIALTAYTHEEDRARALAAGFNAHVSKPVNPQELVVAIAGLTRLTPAVCLSPPIARHA